VACCSQEVARSRSGLTRKGPAAGHQFIEHGPEREDVGARVRGLAFHIAHLARHAAQFGTITGPVTTDMVKVRQRKCDMVEREIAGHLAPFKSSVAELVMGGNFVAPKTLDVQLNDRGWPATRSSSMSVRMR
jgi:hypothetical protein